MATSWRGSGVLTAAMLLASGVPAAATRAAEGDLSAIRQSLADYAESIRTLRGRYVSRVDWGTPGLPDHPDPNHMEDLVSVIEFGIEMPQGRCYIEQEDSWRQPHFSTERPFRRRKRQGFDGVNHYLLEHSETSLPYATRVPAGVPLALRGAAGDVRMMLAGPWAFTGTWLRNNGRSLAGQLDLAEGRLVGRETLHAAPCLRVAIPELHLEAWLDAEREYVPRRIMRLDRSDASRPPTEQLDIFEVRQFPDERSGRMRWLPIRAQQRTPHRRETLEVDWLRVNAELTARECGIDLESLPPGVQVVEWRLAGAGQPPVPPFVTGGRNDLHQERARQAREDRDAALREIASGRADGPSPAAAAATPPTGRSRPLYLAVSVISLLVIALAAVRLATKGVRNRFRGGHG